MRLTACYPSGKTLTAEGQLLAGLIPGTAQFVVGIDTGAEVLVLDPRAVVTADDGRVVYHPRACADELPPWVGECLRDNPNW